MIIEPMLHIRNFVKAVIIWIKIWEIHDDLRTQTQTLFIQHKYNKHTQTFLGNIYVIIHCYDAHTILIVNTAEYLCIATSTKVSSEPLSWKPSWEEVQGKSHCITQQPTLDKIMHDTRYNTTNTLSFAPNGDKGRLIVTLSYQYFRISTCVLSLIFRKM